MTNDVTLNTYLNELQRIINELDNLISEINTNVVGLGQENCTASLQFVSTCEVEQRKQAELSKSGRSKALDGKRCDGRKIGSKKRSAHF